MKYKELCRRLQIEMYHSSYIRGQADEEDLDVRIKDMEDEFAHCFVHINGVQMKFRRLQLGLQRVDKSKEDELWLLISGRGDEKCIRICDIKEIYFNYKGWETIHG